MLTHCKHPWFDIWVNAAGKVTCCPQNKRSFGNLYTESFEALWNSSTAQDVRENIFNGEYEKAGCDKECPYLRGDFKHPSSPPPNEELINPEFDEPICESSYSINYEIIQKEYKNGTIKLKGKPLFIDIQPLLLCNSDCFMCGQPHKDPTKLSDEIMTKLDPLKPYANYFRWQGGEVFLLKNFTDYIENFDNDLMPNLRRYIITNGSKVTNDVVERLTNVERPVHFLVSIDGATEETHYKVRRRKYFKQAMKALKLLANKQKEQGRKDLVRWNYVVMKSTLGEMKLAIKLASEIGVDINFAPIQGNYPDENIFRYQDIMPRDELISIISNIESYSTNFDINISGFVGIHERLSNISNMEDSNPLKICISP